MRALFLVSDDGWNAGARAFLLAGRGLVARGHGVALVTPPESPAWVLAEEAGLPVMTLPASSRAGDALQLRRAIREWKADVVFVHTDREVMLASSAARLARRSTAVVRRIPPFAIARAGRAARFAKRLARTGLLLSTEADRAAADGTGLRSPVSVAPLTVNLSDHDANRAVDKEALGVERRSLLVVCVYDGSDRQPALAALRTVSLLAPRHPALHLAIVGTGDLDELQIHGAALGINGRVSYLGVRDDELSILHAADIGWVASEGDAGAFAALDCMAFGIPVIAHRSPLTEHYVVDGVTGVLLARTDAPTVASAVTSFLAGDRRTHMGAAARARLQREFSYETMLLGFEQSIPAGARDARPA